MTGRVSMPNMCVYALLRACVCVGLRTKTLFSVNLEELAETEEDKDKNRLDL